uniref:Putative homing endonuclease n=1 Tax=viral metagenome TaxID=1070528 RepID=A0A6M3XZ83_9ZZZZ
MPSMPPKFGYKSATNKQVSLIPKGYDWAWRKLRKKRLDSDPLCQHCLENDHVTPAKEVDHIIPRALGGRNEWANTQSLCVPCHRIKTNQDLKRIRGQ